MDFKACVEQRLHGFPHGGAVTGQGRLKLQAFPRRHHGDPVAPQIPVDQECVARFHPSGADGNGMGESADSGGVDKEPVAFAAVDDFGVARDQLHSGPVRRLAHGVQDPPEGAHGESLLENEPGAQPTGARPAHGQIVDGAVDGQCADVASREKERADHKRVGGERDGAVSGAEHRAVVLCPEKGVFKRGQNEVAEQILHLAAASAVSELDAFVGIGKRDRTDGEEIVHGG